jgi:hypothetical protein
VESRVLRTSGIAVPAYNEPPLLCAPPDAEFLTPAQEAEEETERLRLYSTIALRLEGVLLGMEKSVMARRSARGWVERETYSMKQRRQLGQQKIL